MRLHNHNCARDHIAPHRFPNAPAPKFQKPTAHAIPPIRPIIPIAWNPKTARKRNLRPMRSHPPGLKGRNVKARVKPRENGPRLAQAL